MNEAKFLEIGKQESADSPTTPARKPGKKASERDTKATLVVRDIRLFFGLAEKIIILLILP